MTTFIKPDISKVRQYSNGLAFEQLSMNERLAYFRKAGQILKLKNNAIVTSNDKTITPDTTYHDDFFVYYPGSMGNSQGNSDRVVLAIPRDVVKYAFFTKVGNQLHEIMKQDRDEKFTGQGTLKRILTIVRIVCGETGIKVPMYYYNLDKNIMYMPYQYDSGTVHALVPDTSAKGANSGNLDLDWIKVSTEKKLCVDDISRFYCHEEMNVAFLLNSVNSGKLSRINTVMERVLLKKNFVIDTNTVEDETIAQVLFEEVQV